MGEAKPCDRNLRDSNGRQKVARADGEDRILEFKYLSFAKGANHFREASQQQNRRCSENEPADGCYLRAFHDDSLHNVSVCLLRYPEIWFSY